jgi:hypothetical protein
MGMRQGDMVFADIAWSICCARSTYLAKVDWYGAALITFPVLSRMAFPPLLYIFKRLMVALSRMFWPPLAELAGRSGFMLELDLLTRPTNLCLDRFSVPILAIVYASGDNKLTNDSPRRDSTSNGCIRSTARSIYLPSH